MEKLREFTEKYISIHCENYTEREKTIVRNSIQIGYEFLKQDCQDLENQVKALSAIKSGLENSVKDNNKYIKQVKEEIKEKFTNTISIPNELLDKGFEKTKATINKFLGTCKEENCEEKATKDYNGHKHYVCDFHYDKLNKEFDEDYR